MLFFHENASSHYFYARVKMIVNAFMIELLD